ncbi:NUDIX domain-containing protein [Fontivita pretiosa]|uniref:NUDIX domain-containing protein n=1 Tax=Fontivita pretiosa TaxID=2989684 RepID=UPI003D17467B
MRILQGERIGKGAVIAVGAAVVVFDERRERILLTRRRDNNRWCLPGGHMESGESIAETAVREAFEETGLHVELVKLIGVYTSPDFVIQHGDGPRKQLVAICFEARAVAGQIGLSNETTDVGWFTPEQIERMDLIEIHRQRIADALAHRQSAFFR